MITKALINFLNRHQIEFLSVFLLVALAVLGGALSFIPPLGFLAGFLEPGVMLGFIPVFIGFALVTEYLMFKAGPAETAKEDELERIERLKAPARELLARYNEVMERNARLEEGN